MSVNDQDPGAPIESGSPLARVLRDFAAPELPAGFAERVIAAAEARPAPLPPLRRAGGQRRWRLGQRIAIGVASFGVLATAAAATGLLQQLAIPVPTAGTVWAAITGTAAPAPSRETSRAAPAAAPALAPFAIEGPVDTSEELGEAFRRVDQVRADRREERRVIIDQRIRKAIERRRAAGLPVPSPEEEARLRARIEAELVQREQRADAAMLARRETMQRKVESGEALTREDIRSRPPADPQLRETVRELRQLPPAERREAWQKIPPEERRAIIEKVRARRTQTTGGSSGEPETLPSSDPIEAEPAG